jgi:hypothetical protein
MNEMMNEMMKEMMNQMMTTMMQSMMLAMKQSMTGSKTELPSIIDYSSQGIEDSKSGNAVANTPSAPSKKASDVETKYEIKETDLNGTTVYRIKNGVFWRPGNKAEGIKGKGDWLGNKIANSFLNKVDGINRGKFSWTDDNGNTHEYTGWYFTNREDAENALNVLPKVITNADRLAFTA